MFVRTSSLLAFSMSMLLTGCREEAPAKPQKPITAKEAKPAAAPTAKAEKKQSGGTEADAKAALKTVLDSWAFGDSFEKFKQRHPEIILFDPTRITNVPLGRYEFGISRQEGSTFDFLVTLTLKEGGREVTRSASYIVAKLPEGWSITGGVN